MAPPGRLTGTNKEKCKLAHGSQDKSDPDISAKTKPNTPSLIISAINMQEQEGKNFYSLQSEETSSIIVTSSYEQVLTESTISLTLNTPSPVISTKSIQTPPGTGYVHCLTDFQRRILYQFWGMLFEYFSRPDEFAESISISSSTITSKSSSSKYFSAKSASSKTSNVTSKDYAEQMFTNSIGNASSTSLTSTISRISRNTSICSHPLAEELWIQAGTDDLDVLLLRFLRARKWVLLDAFIMAVDTLKWRRNFGVRSLLITGEQALKREILASGKSFFWNVDREGRCIVVLTGRLHDKGAQTLEETVRHTVWCMEIGRRLFQPGVETVTMIFDMGDSPLASLDLGSMQFMIQCFQSYYPESLGKCLVVNAPWIFWGFWKLIKNLLDPVVAGKIEFVQYKELSKFIDPNCLLSCFGGNNQYQYKYVDPTNADIPEPLTEERSEVINAELETIKHEFADITADINTMYLTAGSDVEINTTGKDTKDKIVRRNELKLRLTELCKEIDSHMLSKSFYHRIGVLKDDGTVNWNIEQKHE